MMVRCFILVHTKTYEIYWNDWDDPKGFHVFDTDTRELERIVNPHKIFNKIYYDDTEESISTMSMILVNIKISM